MMGKNATMTAMPDGFITVLTGMDTATKRENGLSPEALLIAKKGGKGGSGGYGGKVGNGGSSPKRDKRDNKRDNKNERKEKDFRK
jgi:hypothetical protein